MDDLGLSYTNVLKDLTRPRGDKDLVRQAEVLSEQLMAAGLGPRDIVSLHAAAVEQTVNPGKPRAVLVAQRLLLEVLIHYGVSYTALAERLLVEADVQAAVERTRANDAAQAEKERLELLAGVSHELGTPLTVIQANIASIRRFLEDHQSWPEVLSQREDDVEFAVERMLALREELLAASRDETRDLEHVPLHVERNVQRVVRWAQLTAAGKDLTFSEQYSATVPYIIGDEWALQSIVSNLLSNAVRYTPHGGGVLLKTYNEGPDVVVEVSDTGIGISEADQSRIFERFYRTAEAQKLVAFGLGLGLAITRDLVSAMGGRITVASHPDGGSTFKVSFSVAELGSDQA